MAKEVKFPKTIGDAVDMLIDMRDKRLAAQKLVDAQSEQEKALQAHIIQKLEEQGMEGAKGKNATVSITKSTQANVLDWTEFYKYISKKKDWGLLQQRTAITALRERWDHKEVIPGVEPITVRGLSLTRR